MEKNYDDTFLARWLADELTPKELKDFEASEDYLKFNQIKESLENAELPEFDLESNFQKTFSKRFVQPNQKKKRIISLLSYGAVASVAVLIFVYTFFFKESTITFYASTKEKIDFTLPDSSYVVLNSSSTITYNSNDWKNNRSLNLDGEAYFKVQKGSKFIVNSNEGSVSVLGTQFTVNSRENIFHITCFEGKVLVVTKKQDSVYLTKNQSFRLLNDKKEEYTITQSEPSWTNNESRFLNMPILLVLEELERQFDVKISGKENVNNELYTGSFSHKNAKIAIQSILEAMEISYTFNGARSVVIKK